MITLKLSSLLCLLSHIISQPVAAKVVPPPFSVGRPTPACSIVRVSPVRLPHGLSLPRWEDDLDCFVSQLNRMLSNADICFKFIFARSTPRLGHVEQPYHRVGYEEYSRCYVSKIYFLPSKHHVLSLDKPFGRSHLAHAFPGNDVHINSEIRWFFHGRGLHEPPPNHIDITATLFHEILHTIGMRHDRKNEHAVMYPYTSGDSRDMSTYRFSNYECRQLLSMYGSVTDENCPL